MPYGSTKLLASVNAGKTTTFSPSNTSMWYLGVVCSILNYAAVFGIISLFFAPAWVIYTLMTALTSGSSWSSYSAIASSYTSDFADFVSQSFLLPTYHYATGFTSVLIFSLMKQYALSSNLAGMSTTDTSSANVA
jgi:hypothetical protein